MARRDWGTVDMILDELKTSGWQGGTQVVGAAFAIAVHRRFAEGYTAADVAGLVKETRAQFQGGDDLPPLEMEGLIRAALGEVELAATIDPDTALQIQIVVLGKLLQDADFTESQLEEFIGEVEQTAARFM